MSKNTAQEDCYDFILDGVEGYRVDLNYEILEDPVDIDKYMEDILKLSPDKYAPFNVNGRVNSGYLFETGKSLGEYLNKLL